MKTRYLGVGIFVFSVFFFTVATLGCGDGINYGSPTSSVAATQNPLVAQYNVTLPRKDATAWVEFGTDTTYGRQTSVTPATTWYAQSVGVLVAGMKPSTTYHMRAHADWFGGGSWVDQDQTFTTGAMDQTFVPVGGHPLVVPTLNATRPSPGLTPAGGVELIDLIAPNTHTLQAFVTDLDGNIIWYYDVGEGNIPYPFKPLANGHFAVNVGISPLLPDAKSVLREIDLAGNTIQEIPLTQVNQGLHAKGYSFSVGGFHHDFLSLPNGHWILLAFVYKNFTNLPGYPGTTDVQGDALIDVDTNGNVVWAWSTFDHLDVNRHPMGLPDWSHGNALVYTPNDGNLLLSMRNQSWILKIDYNNGTGSGDILWRLGEGGDFAMTGGDPAEWFYAQHFPNLLGTNGSQTTLAIWDNGNSRIVNSSGEICGGPPNPYCYSRATIFQIDEASKTASVAWQYLPGFFSFWGGSISQLPNDNVEFDMTAPVGLVGSMSQVMEVTQTLSPQVVWQLDVQDAPAYRAYRLPSLYPGVTWQ